MCLRFRNLTEIVNETHKTNIRFSSANFLDWCATLTSPVHFILLRNHLHFEERGFDVITKTETQGAEEAKECPFRLQPPGCDVLRSQTLTRKARAHRNRDRRGKLQPHYIQKGPKGWCRHDDRSLTSQEVSVIAST